MAIKKANELDFSQKKVTLLIYGRPGIGKTTVAISAPRTLVVDFDDGIDRVEACYRGDTATVDSNKSAIEKYNEFINDLKSSDLSDYDTIVIDTLGKFQELATPVVIAENSVNGQKDGVTLSMKGYGALFSKFKDLNKLVHSLGKHIVWICHATETMDNDVVKSRLNLTGSTKDDVWKDVDLGGFMEMNGNKRYIYFTPSERYDAKGTHGINGKYEIPTLPSTNDGGKFENNTFLSDLFKVYIDDITKSQRKYASDSDIYNVAMELKPIIEKAGTIDELNSAFDKLKTTTHALTSKRELFNACELKAKDLGLVFNKESGVYVVDDTNTKPSSK